MEKSSKLSDVECPICLFILVTPVKTPCNHTFCSHCINELFEFSATNSILCPLCRANLPNINILVTDEEKTNIIEANYKEKSLLRKNDINTFLTNLVPLYYLVGNSHKFLITTDYNKHEWTFYVKMFNDDMKVSDYIDHIEVDLHPTFQPPKLVLFEEPFEIKRMGWGVFDINIKVYWKPWTGVDMNEISHYLSFDGNGKEHKYKVRVDRKKFDEIHKI